jgi:hypothetical protein
MSPGFPRDVPAPLVNLISLPARSSVSAYYGIKISETGYHFDGMKPVFSNPGGNRPIRAPKKLSRLPQDRL